MTSRSISCCLRTFFSLVVYLPLLLFAANAPAQRPDAGMLRLNVRDLAGSSIPGAHVLLTRLPAGAKVELDADADGTLSFGSLAAGTYRVQVEKAGFSSVTKDLDVSAGAPTDVSVQLGISPVEETVAVSAEMNSYQPTANVSTSRLNVPTRELPEEIQVVSRQLLDEQQVLRVGDVTQNIAGVTRSPGVGQIEDQWSIRGFESIGNLFYKDGFRDNASILRDTANLEQIEVLKGGAAAEYGRGDPSGIVNLISKKPLEQTLATLHGTFGSYGLARFAPDVTGPLNRRRTLLYRYNMALERSDSYRHFVTTDREFFAPALTWNPAARTSINLQSEFLQSMVPYDRGTIAINNIVGSVPIQNFYGQPDTGLNTRYFRVMLAGTQQLPKDWRLAAAGAVGFASLRGLGVQIQPGTISKDGTTAMRQNTYRNYRDPFWYFRTDVNGGFRLFGLRNQLATGTDNGTDSVKSGDQNRSSKLTLINLQNPVYTLPLAPIDSRMRQIKRAHFASVFATDFLSLPGHLRLMFGGRLDNYHLITTETAVTPNVTQQYSDLVPTSRVGLSWVPSSAVTVYANTAQSFNPQLGTDYSGTLFQPERGRQYEAGVKGALARGRLYGTLAVFQIRKTNVLTADPLHGGFQLTTGEQQSRGVEVEANGSFTSHWRYSVNYAYLRAEIRNDATFQPGGQLINIPRHAGNLWTVYDFHARALRGLSLGAGLVGVGERPLTQTTKASPSTTSFFLPTYARFDGTVIYDFRRYSVNARVENLTDQAYYPSAFGNNVMVVTGAPRNFRIGLDVRLFQRD